MSRPSPEQIKDALAYFNREDIRESVRRAIKFELGNVGLGYFDVLLSACAPVLDDEIMAFIAKRYGQLWQHYSGECTAIADAMRGLLGKGYPQPEYKGRGRSDV